jgi:hypothetical protein
MAMEISRTIYHMLIVPRADNTMNLASSATGSIKMCGLYSNKYQNLD